MESRRVRYLHKAEKLKLATGTYTLYAILGFAVLNLGMFFSHRETYQSIVVMFSMGVTLFLFGLFATSTGLTMFLANIGKKERGEDYSTASLRGGAIRGLSYKTSQYALLALMAFGFLLLAAGIFWLVTAFCELNGSCSTSRAYVHP